MANNTRNKRNQQNRGRGQRPPKTAQEVRPTRNDENVPKTERNRMPQRNEFSWYNANPQLTEAAARIPFPYRPGMKLPTWHAVGGVGSATLHPNVVPGLMVIDWVPTVGNSADTTSPISLAARDMFSKVRSTFSGSIAADAPDFIMQIMAMDSIYMYLSWLKRVYRVVGTYSPNNLQTPTALLMGMGFVPKEAEALRRRKSDLWGVINSLIAMTDELLVPDIFPVITRHMWMSERVYCDAQTSNSQLYMFNPKAYYRFGVDDKGAGTLFGQGVSVSDPLHPDEVIDRLYNYGADLIEALTSWDDCYLINGYIARAYESERMVRVEPLDKDEKVELSYNTVVLSQIENLTMPVYGGITPTLKIGQEVGNNAIICDVHMDVQSTVAQNIPAPQVTGVRLNIRNDQPSVEEVVEASRLTCGYTYQTQSDGSVRINPIGFATELVVGLRLAFTKFGENGKLLYYFKDLGNMRLKCTMSGSDVSVNAAQLEDALNSISMMTSFDWHPHIILDAITIKGGASDADTANSYLFGDIANLTYLDNNQMESIGRVCLYSEFNSFANG